MSKIIKVEEKVSTYQGKTKKSYLFTLDDGLTGYISNDKPWEYKEGELVSYTKEVKKSSKGEYNLFTFTRLSNTGLPPTPDSSKPDRPQIHVGAGKTKEELKAEAAIRMAEVVVNGFFNDKIESAQVEVKSREYTKLLCSEIDEIFTNKA